jgi:hypothetical protein
VTVPWQFMFIKQPVVAGVLVFGVVPVRVKRDKVVCTSKCVDCALLVSNLHCVGCDKLGVLGMRVCMNAHRNAVVQAEIYSTRLSFCSAWKLHYVLGYGTLSVRSNGLVADPSWTIAMPVANFFPSHTHCSIAQGAGGQRERGL